MSWYEEDGGCISLAICPSSFTNCKRCESKMWIGVPGKTAEPLRCVKCEDDYKIHAGKCIKHNTPMVACPST